jgi:hypothetical protein
VGVATAAYDGNRDIAEALSEAFAFEQADVDPAARERAETLNGIHSNAAGLLRYLETSRGEPTTA